MGKTMKNKTMFLVPSRTGLYSALHTVTSMVAKERGASVGVSVEKALEKASKGLIDRFVVICGARVKNRMVVAPDVCELLKKRGLTASYMDAYDWGNGNKVMDSTGFYSEIRALC